MHSAKASARPGRAAVAAWCLAFACAWHAAAGVGPRAPYELEESFVGDDFFTKWTFYTGGDPTHGTVDFVSYDEATRDGLISASWDRVYMGVDSKQVLWGNQGRKAVKIQSNSVYNNGLFVLKLDHVPSACGSWPAFWMFGEDSQHAWPRWGEYDILEAVHNNSYATTTLHTRNKCDQQPVNSGLDFTGQGWAVDSQNQPAKNCFISAPHEFSNQGCGEKLPTGSFGTPFNQGGGGTYAAEWDPEQRHIRTWFFAAGMEPVDLKSRTPKPEYWGTPSSFFTLEKRYCSPGHFRNMRIVFDTTFCGDYGTPTFAQACPLAGMSCKDFVQKRPKEFAEAYWSIQNLDVYKRGSSTYTAPVSAPLGVSGDISAAGSSSSAASSGGGGWLWLAAGLVLCSCGVAAMASIRYWPGGKVRKTRGVAADVGPLNECLDLNIEQLQQAEMQVPASGSYQQQPAAGQRRPSGQVQPPSPPQGSFQPFSYFQAGAYVQPQVARTASGSQPPTPTRSGQGQSAQGGFFPWPTTTTSPLPSRGSLPPSYVPQAPSGQSFQRTGGGSWGSFIMNGVQNIGGYAGYGGARGQPASPMGSRNSAGYALPPTIPALGPGHIPTGYQPVPSVRN